jgi:hypothetical protein
MAQSIFLRHVLDSIFDDYGQLPFVVHPFGHPGEDDWIFRPNDGRKWFDEVAGKFWCWISEFLDMGEKIQAYAQDFRWLGRGKKA